LQSTEHSKLGGSIWHCARHSVTLQLAVQLASAWTSHLPRQPTSSSPAQAASTAMGVHFASHPPSTSTVHWASASMFTSPHDSMPADAVRSGKSRAGAISRLAK
jgi:hypothetical protein